MQLLQRGLLMMTIGSTVLVPAVVEKVGTPGGTVGDGASSMYTPNQAEFYMTPEDIEWIRPGLNIQFTSVTIGTDRKPVVELTIKDDLNQPLDRLGQQTPGVISMSFVMAWYDGNARRYTSYTTRTVTSPITGVTAIQASADSGGTWTEIELGKYRYTFKTALPEGYDQTKTHTLAMYSSRNLTAMIGKNYYKNIEHDFRPDGATVTEKWEAMANATCNTCHNGELALHGGSRRDVKLCVTCHQPQTTDPDTGNTVDFKVMIHKIHRGEFLPSVEAGTPYQIIGNQQSVHDYSTVAFPQDIRNCNTCHKADAAEGHIWYTKPSAAACGSCHDDVNFTTGENHPAGAQPDSACSSCHIPEGEQEFDASIKGAHTIPTKSASLAGINMEILDVQGALPGGKPTVTFRVSNDDGTSIDPATLTTCRLLIGGPTDEYTEFIRPDCKTATWNGDTAIYTSSLALPATAAGTWMVSADVYRTVSVNGADVREAAVNPLYRVLVSGDALTQRREIVSIDKCNVCHETLALHGGQRFKTDECVICHNPNTSDVAVRPPDQGAPQSVHFKWLIHRLHTGEELEQDFTVYGNRSSVHNYKELRFPGDRRNCQACHVGTSYRVPVAEEALPTPTPRDYYSPMMPIAAACLSCHSSLEAAAHAYVSTAPFGEACAACHGNGREFSVDLVHAR